MGFAKSQDVEVSTPPRTKLRWLVILGLGFGWGLVLGLGEILNWPVRTVELLMGAAVLFSVATIVLVGRRYFLEGFLTGVLMEFVEGLLTIALLDKVIAQNPGLAEVVPGSPTAYKAAIYRLIVFSLLYGVTIGSLAALGGFIKNRLRRQIL
jgi:hypothetical protein